MKISKYILGLALVVAGMMTTSCNTDNVGPTYQAATQNVSFVTTGQSTKTSDASVTIPVRLVRATKSGDYSTSVVVESAPSDIRVAVESDGKVVFADGQAYTTVNVTFEGMLKGYDYSVTLKLADAAVATADTTTGSQVAETTVTVTCDYTWIYQGAGLFTSTAFEDSWSQPIYKAEGLDLYKLPDLYETGADIMVTITDNKVSIASQHAWYYGDDYGWVCVKGEGTKDGNVVTMNIDHFLPDISYSFGVYTETLTMPSK